MDHSGPVVGSPQGMAELQGRICHVVVNGRGTSKPLHGGGFLLRFAGRPCLLTAASVVRSIDDAEGSDVYFNASGAATVMKLLPQSVFLHSPSPLRSKSFSQSLATQLDSDHLGFTLVAVDWDHDGIDKCKAPADEFWQSVQMIPELDSHKRQISVCAPRFKVDSAGQVIPIAAAPDVLLRLNIVAFGPTAPYGMRYSGPEMYTMDRHRGWLPGSPVILCDSDLHMVGMHLHQPDQGSGFAVTTESILNSIFNMAVVGELRARELEARLRDSDRDKTGLDTSVKTLKNQLLMVEKESRLQERFDQTRIGERENRLEELEEENRILKRFVNEASQKKSSVLHKFDEENLNICDEKLKTVDSLLSAMPDGMFLGAEATQEWERTVQERQELLQGRETEAHVRALLASSDKQINSLMAERLRTMRDHAESTARLQENVQRLEGVVSRLHDSNNIKREEIKHLEMRLDKLTLVQMAKDTEARMSEFALYHNSRIEDTAQAGPEDLLQNRHNVCDSTLMRSGTVPFGFIASSAAPVSLKISRNSHGGQSPREAMQSAAARNDPNMFQSTVSEIDWAIEIPDLLSVQQLVTPEGFHAVKLEWGSPRSPLIGHGISEYHIRWRRLATIGVAPQVECIVSPGHACTLLRPLIKADHGGVNVAVRVVDNKGTASQWAKEVAVDFSKCPKDFLPFRLPSITSATRT